ncbi:MAG: DNA-formamidopyrimidine glycosylase family protein [Nakamurella sp.]
MPELPEVETARAVIERAGLNREIADVDDSDSYVCRPHQPGEMKAVLVGRALIAARRRGKTMWCETAWVRGGDDPNPDLTLGLHLGMAGRIFINDADGATHEGGDPIRLGTGTANPSWDRFTLFFADGGNLRMFDKRRLSRARLDPNLEALGPDARLVDRATFRQVIAGSHAPIKARLLDQSVIAGVGNLLADETLWRAKIRPSTPVDELTPRTLTRLHDALHEATESAIAHGGVHTGDVIPARHKGGSCPRCGAAMLRDTVGGRTTWWCSKEQR